VKSHVYLTCCVDSTAAKVNEMTEAAVEVTYDTFARHCDPRECGVFAFYERDARNGLTLKNDSMVSYHRSTYNGVPCYYVCHSCIEYVWVPRGDVERLHKAGEKNEYARAAQSVPAGRVATRDLAGPRRQWVPRGWRDPGEGESGGGGEGWAEPL
jgi:hypothetical protein